MCHTQELYLDHNQIGDAGLTALAKAVESGALASLEWLWLNNNSIVDVGMQALASAVSKGALPQLKLLGLSDNAIGDIGISALASACESCDCSGCRTDDTRGKAAERQLLRRDHHLVDVWSCRGHLMMRARLGWVRVAPLRERALGLWPPTVQYYFKIF